MDKAVKTDALLVGIGENAGVVDVAVVFVDYPDAVGSASELSDARADIKKASAWYSWFSQGNVTYNLRIADRWVRAPKTSNNYFWLHPGKAGTQLMSDVEISDSYKYLASTVVDTSGIAAVWAITPKSAISKSGASGSLFTTMIVFEVCIPARC